MKPVRWMDFPRRLVIGSGVLDDAEKLLKDLGVCSGNLLIITGKRSYELAASKLKDSLEDSGYNVEVLFTKDVTEEEIKRVLDKIDGNTYEIVLGVGGGSKIDMAKVIAHRIGKEYISIPTIASHDGIASPRASIKNKYEQVSIQVRSPIAILADSSIIAQAPHRYSAAGAADVIGNLTAVKDWVLAHKLKGEYFSYSAASLSLTAARIILSNIKSIKPNLEDSVRIIVKSLAISGVSMGVAGSSRPASGSEHLFAHAMTRICPDKALHGELVGIGTIMMMYLHGGSWKRIKRALQTIGAPTTAYDLDIDPEDVITALTLAHKIRKRYTILGETGLTEDAAKKLAKRTGVI